jgi:hypothetical protein
MPGKVTTMGYVPELKPAVAASKVTFTVKREELPSESTREAGFPSASVVVSKDAFMPPIVTLLG